MKSILTFIFLVMTYISFSQDYPKIEIDSIGRKVVVITYEQAQKVDNVFEIQILLEKAGAECDSLNLSYVKVIDNFKKQVSLLEVNINLYKGQIVDKDRQLENLQQRLLNCETNVSVCDEQISVKNEQIVLLKKEIRSLKIKRNIAYGAGIVGVVGGILMVLLLH